MYSRRRHRHNLDSVAIGRFAGEESTTENTVSVGRKAGYSSQAQYAIAIGDHAGEETQGLNAICIGVVAGQTSQSTFGIAIGDQAGRTTQGANAIAIGKYAGKTTQSTMAIAVGDYAGETTQGEGSIAIGEKAGQTSQGKRAIAIGSKAGITNQPEYSIIISTSDTEIVAQKKGLYIDPIRKFDDREGRPTTVKEGNVLSYNYKNDTAEATKEVVTGFPRLPGYPTDAEVALAIKLTAEDAGTMYFDTTKKKIKVYDGAKWTALADEDDIAKVMAAIAASAKTLGTAASAGSKGGVYVAGTEADPFVTGGGGSGAYAPVLYMPDGSKAREGYDYYLEYVPGLGSVGPPVFYKDISVVGVEKVSGNSDFTGPIGDNRPGFIQTTYDNGHVILEQIPVEQWNPPLAALGKLPQEESRTIMNEYMDSVGISFMVSDGKPEALDTYSSDTFRSFLESKGL